MHTLSKAVQHVITTHPLFDLHTHNFPWEWDELLLTSPDDLLTYHYVLREVFRACKLDPQLDATFADLLTWPKSKQADMVWKYFFAEKACGAPISEAFVSVLEIFAALGLDPSANDLSEARNFHAKASKDMREHFDFVLNLAGVSGYCMTNNPFEPSEQPYYAKFKAGDWDNRCVAALRLDDLVLNWERAKAELSKLGYAGVDTPGNALASARQFIRDCVDRLGAAYLMVSLPPDFQLDDENPAQTPSRILQDAVVAVASERKLPLFLMPGVLRQINPQALGAGDGGAPCNMQALRTLAKRFPEVMFWITPLSFNDQYQLCMDAAVLPNIVPWGTWWYNLQPSLVKQITAMRLEMLGTSFWPQHSDARHLWHLISKWKHTREMLVEVLSPKFAALEKTGARVTEQDIINTLGALFDTRRVGICL